MAAKQIFCRHVYKGYMERGAIRFLPVTDKQAGDTENTIGCADRSLPESVQVLSFSLLPRKLVTLKYGR